MGIEVELDHVWYSGRGKIATQMSRLGKKDCSFLFVPAIMSVPEEPLVVPASPPPPQSTTAKKKKKKAKKTESVSGVS